MKTLPANFYLRTPTPELFDLVQNRLLELGFQWRGGGCLRERFPHYKEETCIGASESMSLTYSPAHYYKGEIQIADLFLSELPKKEIVIDNVLPWTVVIKGDKVDIGCQKELKLDEVLTFIKNAPSLFGNTILFGKKVTFGLIGMWYNEQQLIRWETFNKLVEELKKLKLIP